MADLGYVELLAARDNYLAVFVRADRIGTPG